MQINKGDKIGLLGKSGSEDKLCKYCVGLLSPTKGLIKIDKEDIFFNLAAYQKLLIFTPRCLSF